MLCWPCWEGCWAWGSWYALLRVVAAEMAQFRPEAAALIPSNTTLLPIGLGFSLGACLLFGTLPAIRLSRRDIASSLKGGTTPAVARFVGYRARDLVVFVELGVAVALVVTTALFVRFFVELQRITPLFPADKVVVVALPVRDAAGAADRISGLPGVVAVASASDMPGSAHSSSAAVVRAASGRTGRGALVGSARRSSRRSASPLSADARSAQRKRTRTPRWRSSARERLPRCGLARILSARGSR